MKIFNYFRLNQIPFKKLILIVLTLHLIFFGTIFMDNYNFYYLLIPQLFLIIYIFFIPGILFLRIFRVYYINTISVVLYAVGLSIISQMLVFYCSNLILPFLNIKNPLNIIYIFLVYSIFILSLLIGCYLREISNPPLHENNDIEIQINSTLLFACLIPLITILIIYILNNFNLNFSSLIVLMISFLFVFIAMKRKIIPESYFPVIIFCISISLLFQQTLISPNVRGGDVQEELFLSILVKNLEYWSINLRSFSNVTGMISITIFPAVISSILKIETKWFFKIIYPIIFSLFSIIVFEIYKKQTNSSIAFLGVFYLISSSLFYILLPTMNRQIIAEVFFALIILLFLDNQLEKPVRGIFLLLFGIGVIISHYGLAYILAISFVTYLVILFFYNYLVLKIYNYERSKNLFGRLFHHFSLIRQNIPIDFIIFYFTFLAVWFVYVSPNTFGTGSFFYRLLTREIFGPNLGYSTDISLTKPLSLQTYSTAIDMSRIIFFILALFTIIGYIYVFFKQNDNNQHLSFKSGYLVLCISFFILMVTSLILPSFGNTLEFTRIFHICMIPLSIFCPIGGYWMYLKFLKLFQHESNPNNTVITTRIIQIGCFLIAALLLCNFWFQSGLVFEYTKDTPLSFSISYNQFSDQFVQEPDMSALQWIILTDISQNRIFTIMNMPRTYWGHHFAPIEYQTITNENFNSLPDNSILLISYGSILMNKIRVTPTRGLFNPSEFISINDFKALRNKNKIFDDSAQIFI